MLTNLQLMFKILLIFVALHTCFNHLIKIQATQPHNRNCYSQGLFFINQTHIFETCGLYNHSYFHILQYQSDPFKLIEVESSIIPWKINIFMQGAILFKGYLYILTWRESIVYKLQPATFEVVEEIRWKRQGWGLTHNGTHMFTTDGSDTIFLIDQNFELVGQKAITNQVGRRLHYMNELEYVDGYIYANIYLDSKIAKIDYERGKVVEIYDARNLINEDKKKGSLRNDQVINGIAYDAKNDKFILTGKHWSQFYQVQLNDS